MDTFSYAMDNPLPEIPVKPLTSDLGQWNIDLYYEAVGLDFIFNLLESEDEANENGDPN